MTITIPYKRVDGRAVDELRPVSIERGIIPHAEGSALIKVGNTHVICTASVVENVPRWMAGSGSGWVTAEYSMLPRATAERSDREAVRGKQGGRTVEIQRLIGRALRAVVDMRALGERQIIVDCDVISADGGTRCASITGGYVALSLAIHRLQREKKLRASPLQGMVAAISVGVIQGVALLDLNYGEDSHADVDSNIVMTDAGAFIELQGTAEQAPFTTDTLTRMIELGTRGTQALFAAQRAAIEAD